MQTLIIAIVGFVVIAGVALVIIGMRGTSKKETLEDRLAELGAMERPPTLEELELSVPFSERVIMPILEYAAGLVSRFKTGTVGVGVDPVDNCMNDFSNLLNISRVLCVCWIKRFYILW